MCGTEEKSVYNDSEVNKQDSNSRKTVSINFCILIVVG